MEAPREKKLLKESPPLSGTLCDLFSCLAAMVDNDQGKDTLHCRRSALLAALICMDQEDAKTVTEVFFAGLLKDIATVGLPFHITRYLEDNSSLHNNLLYNHSVIAADIVSGIPGLQGVSRIIRDHHEWFDGQGYPAGKSGKSLSFPAQALRLADSLDIFLRKKPAMNDIKARFSLRKNKEFSGRLFDSAWPRLSEKKIFNALLENRSFLSLFSQTCSCLAPLDFPRGEDVTGKALKSVSQVADMKNSFGWGHSARVSNYALECAQAIGLDHNTVTSVKWGGLMHDSGKIMLQRPLLDKPSRLSHAEELIVRRHAKLTRKITSTANPLGPIGILASKHHERLDGSGYPEGLMGAHIPLEARILAVCDSYDAMTCERSYRPALSTQEAVSSLKSLSGKLYDPEIVDAFLSVVK